MALLDLIGPVADVIAIFGAAYGIGYGVGVWRTNRRWKAIEEEIIAKKLTQFLGAVQIKKINCEAKNPFVGQTISLSLIIENEGIGSLEVWLGASIVSQRGDEYYDISQDKPIILESGTKTYPRYLTIPMNADSGEYYLYVAVWLGKTADPKNSIRLARLRAETKLNIQKR